MSQPPQHFKALVLGSGQGGIPLTSALAAAGHSVALIESTHIGGTCINEGCTPTKTMVASAKVANYARRAADFGVMSKCTGGSAGKNHGGARVYVDMEVVRKRKREIVDSFRGGSEGRLEGAEGVEVIRGKAIFTGPKEVEVLLNEDGGVRKLSAEWVFINVGCRPAPLIIPGMQNVPMFLDSTTVMELDFVPEHLVVVGGGYVGLEFAQMFKRFGAKVTVVQHGKQLLGREDEDVADAVKGILEEDGVQVLLEARVLEVLKYPGNEQMLIVSVKDTKREIMCTHVLGAAGRVPSTDLGLEKAGVEMGKGGFVKVDESLRTNVDGIFAMGDVKGGPAFTHISYDDFRVLKSNLLDGVPAVITDRLVPYVVFIDPQLGRVGITETEARTLGKKIKVGKMPMAWVARALEMDESRGFMKVIVDGESGLLLGAAILGIDGGEVMSMLQIGRFSSSCGLDLVFTEGLLTIFVVAMMGKLPYTALRDGVFAHPLLAESLNNLFGNLEG